MPGPSESQVRTFVAKLRERRQRDAQVIGIRADRWDGPSALEIGGASYRVAFCQSPLHVREELLDRADGQGLIVLTPLGENDLGGDVVARLARRQVYTIEPWRVVQGLFGATRFDPRLRHSAWVAEALVESVPPEGYPASPGGVLDADTVWDALLRLRFGFFDGRPDVLALVRWAESATMVAAYLALPANARDDVRARIRETAGVAGLAVLDALEVVPGTDVVGLGLACSVLFQAPAADVRDAAVRFERYHRQGTLSREAGLQWADAADRVLREIEAERGTSPARTRAERADRILEDLGAGSVLHLAAWSPAGLDQRLSRLASALDQARTTPEALAAAEAAGREALTHRLASRDESEGRRRRIEMGLRVARWLHTPARGPAQSLTDAIDAYCREGAFVDLARLALLGGDHPAELGQAYAALLGAARLRREIENQEFGALLAGAGVAPPSGQVSVVPVEQVVESALAPAASARRVMFLVMDGLSRSIYCELADAIAADGGRLWKVSSGDTPAREWSALAAVPSVTEVSRTSLFCGRLVRGTASDERRGFASHQALLRVSRPARPPVVFHKGDLLDTAGRGLSPEVAGAIASSDQQVVGVVLNVVDDLLFKADQIQPRWTLDAAPLLRDLLAASRRAGRLVLLTSDHGHLLDDDTAFQGREAGERWREDEGEPREGEIRLAGRRVLGGERASIVAPWSERLRYSGKRNGYHGGASLQEMVLPLALLSWGDDAPEGFVEAAIVHPPWWVEAVPRVAVRSSTGSRLTARVETARPLLDVMEAPLAARAPLPGAAAPLQEPAWVTTFVASARYIDQRSRFRGRGVPGDEEVRMVLMVLCTRGDQMTRTALAASIGWPLVRLNGLIAGLRRLLNVDGLPVLDVHAPSDTVKLDRELLLKQFEVADR